MASVLILVLIRACSWSVLIFVSGIKQTLRKHVKHIKKSLIEGRAGPDQIPPSGQFDPILVINHFPLPVDVDFLL